jgi:hypothetical protein
LYAHGFDSIVAAGHAGSPSALADALPQNARDNPADNAKQNLMRPQMHPNAISKILSL